MVRSTGASERTVLRNTGSCMVVCQAESRCAGVLRIPLKTRCQSKLLFRSLLRCCVRMTRIDRWRCFSQGREHACTQFPYGLRSMRTMLHNFDCPTAFAMPAASPCTSRAPSPISDALLAHRVVRTGTPHTSVGSTGHGQFGLMFRSFKFALDKRFVDDNFRCDIG